MLITDNAFITYSALVGEALHIVTGKHLSFPMLITEYSTHISCQPVVFSHQSL